MTTKTKLVKRIFSSLLTAALAVPMTALTAHATGEAFFYPPKNPVMTDQQFEVSVTFSADSEIGSVQANIAYDDSVIEFVSSDNASGGGGVLTVNGFPDTPLFRSGFQLYVQRSVSRKCKYKPAKLSDIFP